MTSELMGLKTMSLEVIKHLELTIQVSYQLKIL